MRYVSIIAAALALLAVHFPASAQASGTYFCVKNGVIPLQGAWIRPWRRSRCETADCVKMNLPLYLTDTQSHPGYACGYVRHFRPHNDWCFRVWGSNRMTVGRPVGNTVYFN